MQDVQAWNPRADNWRRDFDLERRQRMVSEQLIARGICDRSVLFAMDQLPRHRFVPAALREQAYSDRPLPIGFEQTISQPYMVALMLQALELDGRERVLEIGTGSGYQAALLGLLAAEVYSVEIIPELARRARRELEGLGIDNVCVIDGDGTAGYPRARPYDAIVVAAGAPAIPKALLEQLAEGGRLVIPVGQSARSAAAANETVGAPHGQVLLRVRNQGSSFVSETFGPCLFVPLVSRSIAHA
jgi:protein-L-isoaspartate(D-aspartate) O-methyltransferase